MAKRKEMAECRRTDIKAIHGVLTRLDQWIEVRVMCRAEGWAMVRRKGAMPFCVPEKDLRAPEMREGRPD